MRSMSPVPKSPAGTGSTSREEGCSSATEVAETVVAGRQDARPQRDSWCEVGWPEARDGARTNSARPGADGKALMFPSLSRHPYCRCR
jgi:hypothetical protein